jgi:hypothetical protein
VQIARLTAATIGVFVAFPALAATLNVPSAAYPTVQSALNAADLAGDEIVVAAGTYTEALDLLGKAVVLRSASGPALTTLRNPLGTVIAVRSGEGRQTRIEGFTIRDGVGVEDFRQLLLAGGLLVQGASPTIVDCIFTANSADLGAAALVIAGSPLFDRCRFLQNEAFTSSAVDTDLGSTAEFVDCRFELNVGSFGGAITFARGSSGRVTGCHFVGNIGSDSGAIANFSGSSPLIERSSFINNTGDVSGAIDNFSSCSPTIRACTFEGNTGGFDGNAIGCFSNCSPTIVNCIINDGSKPGAPLAVSSGSSPVVVNCTFIAAAGPLVETSGSSTQPSTTTIVNSILWTTTPGTPLVGGTSGTNAVTYSIVRGGFAGTGNIDADPLFANSATGDFRLGSGSPAIDSGSNAAVPAGVTTDAAGAPRFADVPAVLDTGVGAAPIVDRGAYEQSAASVCAADFNQDGVPNLDDIFIFLNAWFAQDPRADTNNDGLNIDDLFIFLNLWFASC